MTSTVADIQISVRKSKMGDFRGRAWISLWKRPFGDQAHDFYDRHYESAEEAWASTIELVNQSPLLAKLPKIVATPIKPQAKRVYKYFELQDDQSSWRVA